MRISRSNRRNKSPTKMRALLPNHVNLVICQRKICYSLMLMLMIVIVIMIVMMTTTIMMTQYIYILYLVLLYTNYVIKWQIVT